MVSHYRAVVIGGGVVGTSVLCHLAKPGWTDVSMVERNVLTAGPSWHAAIADGWEVVTEARRMRMLEIADGPTDASGLELVWRDGHRICFVTSFGYGHWLEKSLALAMFDAKNSDDGTDLTVHIAGVERAAHVIAASPYDPAGQAMRR